MFRFHFIFVALMCVLCAFTFSLSCFVFALLCRCMWFALLCLVCVVCVVVVCCYCSLLLFVVVLFVVC